MCPASAPGVVHTIVGYTESILTEDRSNVAGVLRELEAVGMEQAMEAGPAAAGAQVMRRTTA